ncbi:hypothetical protein ACFWUU_23845 [Kribbella sp. NPDC058693]|uniref:hypothetical protein n=1 Tax=Kribbella sp. NPDC058693 TaxID=3346602 RepID=UPI0036655381
MLEATHVTEGDHDVPPTSGPVVGSVQDLFEDSPGDEVVEGNLVRDAVGDGGLLDQHDVQDNARHRSELRCDELSAWVALHVPGPVQRLACGN